MLGGAGTLVVGFKGRRMGSIGMFVAVGRRIAVEFGEISGQLGIWFAARKHRCDGVTWLGLPVSKRIRTVCCHKIGSNVTRALLHLLAIAHERLVSANNTKEGEH